jgi:hypothetical protein
MGAHKSPFFGLITREGEKSWKRDFWGRMMGCFVWMVLGPSMQRHNSRVFWSACDLPFLVGWCLESIMTPRVGSWIRADPRRPTKKSLHIPNNLHKDWKLHGCCRSHVVHVGKATQLNLVSKCWQVRFRVRWYVSMRDAAHIQSLLAGALLKDRSTSNLYGKCAIDCLSLAILWEK